MLPNVVPRSRYRLAMRTALVCAALLMLPPAAGVSPVHAGATPLVKGSALGGPFSLTDHTGRTVTEQTFRGRYMLIYFGYTYCPDVCPTDLANMATALDLLGPLADRVQPIFITLDPKRDTVAQLANYVGVFHPRLIGLTGTRKQIDDVAKAYLVEYFAFDAVDNDEYEVAHTARTFLMGPDGRYLRWFQNAADPGHMADVMRALIERQTHANSSKVP